MRIARFKSEHTHRPGCVDDRELEIAIEVLDIDAQDAANLATAVRLAVDAFVFGANADNRERT